MAVTGSKIIKTAGKYLGNGGSFVWKYYGLSTGTAWCAAFVSYVMNKAGAKSLFYDGKSYSHGMVMATTRKEAAETI